MLASRDSSCWRELAEWAKVLASWLRDGPQPRTSSAAFVTAARSVTLCASSASSRVAACRRPSCDEADDVALVVPVAPLAGGLPDRARRAAGISRRAQAGEHRRG